MNDPGLYAAMGKAVFEGRQLYVEIWDTKLPGVALLTTPLYAAFGDRWWMWVAFSFVAMSAAVWLLSAAARHVAESLATETSSTSSRAGIVTAAAGLALLNFHWILITGFQLETPMIAFACLGALATIRALTATRFGSAIAWAFLAGIGGGLAATIKPTGLAVSGAAIVALLELARHGEMARALRLGVALVAGIAVMIAVNLAWFSYLAVWPFLGDVWREISLYSSGTPWAQIFTLKVALILIVLAWPTLAFVGLATASRHRNAAPSGTSDQATESTPANSLKRVAFAFVITWLLVEIVGSILQKRGYAYHFQPIAAPATLLVGIIVAAARPHLLPRLSLALTAAVAPLVLLSLAGAAPLWRDLFRGERRHAADLVQYIQTRTSPDEMIFADPVGELAVMSGRRPGARIGQMIALINHDAAPEKFSRMVIDDLERNRCAIVVLPIPAVLKERIAGWEKQPVLKNNPQRVLAYRAGWKRFVDYVHANYDRERRDVDGREIWRRRGTSAPSTSTAPSSAG